MGKDDGHIVQQSSFKHHIPKLSPRVPPEVLAGRRHAAKQHLPLCLPLGFAAGQKVKKRRLAATGWPHQSCQLRGVEVERHLRREGEGGTLEVRLPHASMELYFVQEHRRLPLVG